MKRKRRSCPCRFVCLCLLLTLSFALSGPADAETASLEQGGATGFDLFEKALELLELRHFTRATELLEIVVIIEEENPSAWYALGRAWESRGFFPRAQAAYRRTLDLDPTFPPLSRVLVYPDPKRQPLWDPNRPARIEEIPARIDGFTISPPATAQPPSQGSQLVFQPQPTPEEKTLPAYVPPAPGPVYVPPPPDPAPGEKPESSNGK